MILCLLNRSSIQFRAISQKYQFEELVKSISLKNFRRWCTVAHVFEHVQVKIEIREIYTLDLSFGDNTINTIRCLYQGK